jgi:DmsE family decaheme c-type cytochrome
MAIKPWVLGGIGALVFGLSVVRLGAQATPTPTPAPAKATAPATTPAAAMAPAAAAPSERKGQPVEEPACVACHEDKAKSFPGNPHTRIRGAEYGKSGVGDAPCASCHGPGTKHMESSGEDKSDVRIFKGRAGADFCLTCHNSNKAPSASYRTGVHASTEAVNCLSCHSIHTSEPKEAHLLVRQSSELCANCHAPQAASFREKPFAHRIGRGGMDCASCHEPHGLARDKALRLTPYGESPCLNCHAEKRGPFVFEHVNNVAGTCTSCHEPHGSSNNKRLIRSRVDKLCLECHSNLSSKTLGSQPPSFHNISLPRYQNCTTCHVAVHGSNLSPQLLK